MVALRHAQMCESVAAESEAEKFDSPEIEVVKDQLPMIDAGYSLLNPTSTDRFRKELDYLWEVSDKSERQHRHQKCPITMKLGFLVSSLPRHALRLLGRYLPFSCKKTIHRSFHNRKKQVARQLTQLDQIDQQIPLFVKITTFPQNSVVSFSVDAIAMNPDRSHLPSKESEHAFAIFLQALDRQYRCLPVHIKLHESGQATADAQDALKMVDDALSKYNLIMKYQCADGERGHNQAHLKFFSRMVSCFADGMSSGSHQYHSAREESPRP
jgi:hypothetical protein